MTEEIAQAPEVSVGSVVALLEEIDSVEGATLTDTLSSFDVGAQKDAFLVQCEEALEENRLVDGMLSSDTLTVGQKVDGITRCDSTAELSNSDGAHSKAPSPSVYPSNAPASVQLEKAWWDHERKATALFDERDNLSIHEIVQQLRKLDKTVNASPSSFAVDSAHCRKRSITADGLVEPSKKLQKVKPSLNLSSVSSSSLSKVSKVSRPTVAISPDGLCSYGGTEGPQTTKTSVPRTVKLTVTSRHKKPTTKEQERPNGQFSLSVGTQNMPFGCANSGLDPLPLEADLGHLLDNFGDASASLTDQQRSTLEECFSDFLLSANTPR
ncbi:hypothetical protein RvY_18957 [Ramazzottius varieornatus]|uniref:Uncharacterized protein n=1 Tax=Ramazzottius varieornatus TaxID=947166 RepID=A0A1D1W7N9_RAMVA|nr:hypothetical protein RvY_18957 [Ramazzottius varieornatus]